MCDFCVTTDYIQEIEARHGVKWCDGCNRYYSADAEQCSVCALIAETESSATLQQSAESRERAVNAVP